MQRCDELARCSEESDRLTRLFCSAAMAAAHRLLRQWADEAGLTCRSDSAANFFVRFEPPGCDVQRKVLLGSHLDTVVDAGRYDGTLGVALALAVVEELARQGARLPWVIEAVAFSEEEGIRYRTPFLGSRALAGSFDDGLLGLADDDGVVMAEALRRFGVDPAGMTQAAAKPGEIVAYLEPHIEQGPQLELAGQPLAVVAAIAGQTRLAVTWSGPGGHAGTVPMDGRRDALTAGCRWALAVERMGQATPGLVATVGRLQVEPNAGNCIARCVAASLDVRHADDQVRGRAVSELVELAEQIARDSQLSVQVEYHHEHAATPMDGKLSDLLAGAAKTGRATLRLVSGAGHDAGVMAAAAPTAMLFIRCRGGVSHSPREAVEHADVAAAIEALLKAVWRLAESPD